MYMGKVYLVGAGPGDIDLITIKALKCIEKADVILYDRLINKELLNYAKENVQLIYCGKRPGFHIMTQEKINQLLIKYAKQGKDVIRLKGGDPFIFGRGGEEAAALVDNGVSFEIVPGITSGIAVPAYAGIPVTNRGISSSFAMITCHHQPGEQDPLDWKSLAKGIDTLAIYMGISNLPYICKQLISFGRSPDTPVAIIHWGTTIKQHTITGTLSLIVELARKSNIKNPSMIIVGEVVRFREKLQWFNEFQLNGALVQKAST